MFADRDAPPVPAPVEPVDIVVPVHDAHDDLVACLERLERHTEPRHRVILVDDASPDPRIAPLLAAFAARRPGTFVLRLDENGGFVAAANAGLAAARGDVVLLNTDAFVSPGWLDRLMRPMRDDPTVATVTPLTTDGEIASAPRICRRSEPDDAALAAMEAAALRLDPLRATVEAPTGVGFCMAMAARWLDRVPAFDPAFGRGYGEEVDWCRKVEALGGRHLLTGAVFVRHRGGGSFGAEKAERVARNNRIVSKRHRGYDAEVAAFVARDPLIGPRFALDLAAAAAETGADGTGPLPIYLGHHLKGGAEQWLRETLGRDRDAGRHAIVVRDGIGSDHALIELHRARRGDVPPRVTRVDVPLDDLKAFLALPVRRELTYSCLVGARAPLALLRRAVASLAPEDGLRVLFHDFYPLCPSYNLLTAQGAFCGLPARAACDACHATLVDSGAGEGARPVDVPAWRAQWRGVLGRADEIVTFAPSSRDLVARVWPHLADRILVRPHDPSVVPATVAPPARADGLPVVGVLGAIGQAKGAAVLHRLAETAGDRLRLVVIGRISSGWSHPHLHVHGDYDRDHIADLAADAGIERWLIPSIWPETFSYTTHEALATGLPVHAFDLGAQADALRDHPNGHLLPLDATPEALAEALGAAPRRKGRRGGRLRRRRA
nr:glycosyltransferase [Jannaschia sp. Os4]